MKDAQDDDPVSEEEEGAPAVDEMDALLEQMRQLRADIEQSSTSVGQLEAAAEKDTNDLHASARERVLQMAAAIVGMGMEGKGGTDAVENATPNAPGACGSEHVDAHPVEAACEPATVPAAAPARAGDGAASRSYGIAHDKRFQTRPKPKGENVAGDALASVSRLASKPLAPPMPAASQPRKGAKLGRRP